MAFPESSKDVSDDLAVHHIIDETDSAAAGKMNEAISG